MPTIKSSADLRNNYNEISTYCHNYPEPVFITKNGKGDLAVMSIEAYEELTSRFELYSQIKEGMDDIAAGNTRPFQEAMADIRSRRRTRVVGTFPDGNSALMLVCARLRHVAGTQWGSKKYMNMKHLEAALDDASIAG